MHDVLIKSAPDPAGLAAALWCDELGLGYLDSNKLKPPAAKLFQI